MSAVAKPNQCLDHYMALERWGVGPLDPDRLYSFSADPDLVVHDNPVSENKFAFKPTGLWYTPGSRDNWLDWCVQNGGLSFLNRYLYELQLDHTHVCQLTTTQDLLAFTQEFGTHELGWKFTRQIDWAQVWRKFSGIEIVPYRWESRLEPTTHWYYSWDCASGCTWRRDAVLAVKLIGERQDRQ